MNTKEKERQVPLMQRIYSQATSVQFCLGRSTPEIQGFMVELPQVLEVARQRKLMLEEGIDPLTRPDCSMPPKGDPFWGGCHQILYNQWFRRLWTLQEVVFAKHVTILCGIN